MFFLFLCRSWVASIGSILVLELKWLLVSWAPEWYFLCASEGQSFSQSFSGKCSLSFGLNFPDPLGSERSP